MKYVAIVLAVLVLAAAALGVYGYVNARLIVTSIELKASTGASREGEFLSWQAAIDAGTVAATTFAQSMPGSAEDYSFFVYTFRIRNRGLINAEMVEIQPAPVNGDVLSYSTAEAANINLNETIAAGSEKNMWSTIVTSAQNQQNHIVTRTFYITYYVWGIPMTVTAIYN